MDNEEEEEYKVPVHISFSPTDTFYDLGGDPALTADYDTDSDTLVDRLKQTCLGEKKEHKFRVDWPRGASSVEITLKFS